MPTEKKAFDVLRERVAEISDIDAALALLEWDQQTYMPDGAAESRALQIETLTAVGHEKSTSPEIGKLLELCANEDYEPDSFESAFLAKMNLDYKKQCRIPTELASKIASASARTQSMWEEARPESDFKSLVPALEDLLRLKKEYANLLYDGTGHLYDALLDDFEQDMTVRELDAIFQPLKKKLIPFAREICAKPQEDDAFLHLEYDPGKQLEFCRFLVGEMGYDWKHGRLDLSAHPFTTGFGLDDVRITSRVHPNLPMSCIFSCIHECGHALYELGIDKSFRRSPLADGASLGFHESQSRLWENQIGRSRPFWAHFYPILQEYFPKQLESVTLKSFQKAVNKVAMTPIRTEADEVTYNLHILLRYEIEKMLLEDSIKVAELPDVWNAKMKEYLGFEPESNSEGVMQDVHWYCGLFGYFPTYALGNLIAAQIWNRILKDIPAAEEQIALGKFGGILTYLRGNLHVYGAKYSPKKTLNLLLGTETIDLLPFLNYLEEKYL